VGVPWATRTSVLLRSNQLEIGRQKETETKTRKVLTVYELHHPTADIDKLEVQNEEEED
jgi:hypothetical protein